MIKVKRDEEKSDLNKYGIPQLKKFPMPDAKHVKSAIKFFNYVTPKYEKELAMSIIARAKEYGVDFSKMNIGEDNRFSKYIPDNSLAHHGILGQKWGVRRFQNPDGTLTEAGKNRYGNNLAKKVYTKQNSADPTAATNKLIRESKLIKDFNTVNNTYKALAEAALKLGDFKRISSDMTNAAMKRKYGGDFKTLDYETQRKYIADGAMYIRKHFGEKADVLQNEWIKASINYEKALSSYITKYTGKTGTKELSDPMAIYVNLTTGKIGKQTINDRIILEALRAAGAAI